MKIETIFKTFSVSLFFLLLIISCGTTTSTIKENSNVVESNSQMPSWIIQTPKDNYSYIGIGSAKKVDGSIDHIQTATNSALNMIASKIEISISSNVVNSLIEKGDIIEEEFRSKIRAKTQMDLEGYELVDSWENQSIFYVYYKLSKQRYETIKKKKRDEAIQLALDNRLTATNNLTKNNYEDAIKYYIKSLEAIESYLSETLEANVDGEDVYLGNYLYKKLQDVFSDINLIAENKNITAELGQPLESAIFKIQNDNGENIEDFPIIFSFIRGNAEFIPTGKSNVFGKCKVSISKIKSTKDLQTIEAKYDVSKLLNTESIILNKLLTTLSIPSARITINVKKPIIYIDSKEMINENVVNIARIEPVVKEKLSSMNFKFTELPFNNNWEIKIIANARSGSQISSLFTSFADLTFSVTEVESGNEIYKTTLNHIKGIDLSFEKAGYKALENIAQQVNEEIIPDMLGNIQ